MGVESSIGLENSAELDLVKAKGSRIPVAHHPLPPLPIPRFDIVSMAAHVRLYCFKKLTALQMKLYPQGKRCILS